MTEVKRATIPHLGRFYAEDPGPPYVLFDCYPQDRGESPDFADAEETDVDGDGDADVIGGVLKFMDGTGWGKDNCDWAIRNAQRIRGLVGGYHMFQASQPWEAQADAYLWVREEVLKKADETMDGGMIDRLMVAIVDVERGGERSLNYHATAQQWVDGVTPWANKVAAATGHGVMLYGRGAMRDLYITSKMGCDRVWCPAYTANMALNGITFINGETRTILPEKMEWKRKDVVLWQDVGDGTTANRRMPCAILGLGKIDTSIAVGPDTDDGTGVTFAQVRTNLCT